MLTIKTLSRLSVFVIGAAATACSSSSSPSLTAPSVSTPAPASSLSATSGATIHGTVAGGTSTPARSTARAAGMTVSVNGSNVTSSVGADGSFTLSGVPTGPVELRFSTSGSEARGSVGNVADQEQVTITVVINGATAQVTVQKSEAEGTIAGLTTGCPAVTFTVGAARVFTDTTTTFVGGTCSQLANGGRAEVTGTKQSDGSIKAVTVKVEDAPATTPPTTPAPTARELSGIVSGLGTSACPVTTFTVGTTKVTTDASTTFTGGTCLQMKNTMTVEINGAVQPDGSLKASLVNLEDAAEQAATEVDGAVSALAGVAGCPVTAFTVGTTKVTTNAATTFTGGTCSQLANTVKVEVTGTKQADGSIKASRVNLEDVGDKETEVEVEVDGKISGLGSVAACPITTFTIGTTKVTTSGATEFKDGTCPQLANNLTVQVKGGKQTDGSLKAARVDFEKN